MGYRLTYNWQPNGEESRKDYHRLDFRDEKDHLYIIIDDKDETTRFALCQWNEDEGEQIRKAYVIPREDFHKFLHDIVMEEEWTNYLNCSKQKENTST